MGAFDELDEWIEKLFNELDNSTKDCPTFLRWKVFVSIANIALHKAKQAESDHIEEIEKMQSEFLTLLSDLRIRNDDCDDIDDSISEESKKEFLN